METPNWNTGDGIRSIRDFGKLILEWIDRKDTELADRLNNPDDELPESTTPNTLIR